MRVTVSTTNPFEEQLALPLSHSGDARPPRKSLPRVLARQTWTCPSLCLLHGHRALQDVHANNLGYTACHHEYDGETPDLYHTPQGCSAEVMLARKNKIGDTHAMRLTYT